MQEEMSVKTAVFQSLSVVGGCWSNLTLCQFVGPCAPFLITVWTGWHVSLLPRDPVEFFFVLRDVPLERRLVWPYTSLCHSFSTCEVVCVSCVPHVTTRTPRLKSQLHIPRLLVYAFGANLTCLDLLSS